VGISPNTTQVTTGSSGAETGTLDSSGQPIGFWSSVVADTTGVINSIASGIEAIAEIPQQVESADTKLGDTINNSVKSGVKTIEWSIILLVLGLIVAVLLLIYFTPKIAAAL
jgi:hypothetical protein